MNKASSHSSAQRLFQVLRNLAGDPSSHTKYPNLIDSLKRQGALARFQCLELGIQPMALNTLKRASNEALQEHGGFAALDSLRREVLNALENLATSKRTSSDSRDILRSKLRQSKEMNLQLREDLSFMSDRLLVALSLAERLAMSADPLTKRTFMRQHGEIIKSLGLRRLTSASTPEDE